MVPHDPVENGAHRRMTGVVPGRGAVVAAIVVGGIAGVIGAASVISYAGHLLSFWDAPRGETSGTTAAYVTGNALLVVAETVAVLLFTILGAAAMALSARAAAALLVVVAATKVLWLIASIGANWKPGWYFMADPSGRHSITLLLLVASVAQGVALIVAAVGTVGGLPPAPPPDGHEHGASDRS